MLPKYLESLREGYLWFADVLSLNDKSDSIVYYGGEKENNEFKQYYVEHELDLILAILERFVPIQELKDSLSTLSKDTIMEMICIIKKSDKEIYDYLISKGVPQEHIDKYFEIINQFKPFFEIKEKKFAEKMAPITNFNDTLREKLKVFSMSDSYDIPSLWGTYADGNRGFCIEYDFNKMKDKNILDNLRKVTYLEKRTALSYIDLFKNLIFKDDAKDKIARMFEEQLLAKDSSWSSEREWRVVIADHDNKYFVDLVTAIYIDEFIEYSNDSYDFINLAKLKGWKVFIRRLAEDFVTYQYDKIN